MLGRGSLLAKDCECLVPQAFGEDFLEDKLKPFFKSDPIPETVSYLHFLAD
jgi:hypothetical protein